MHRLTTPLLILVLALAACGTPDDRDPRALAREAFDAGEYARAEEHYATALAGMPATDAAFTDLKVEHLQALCYVNGDETLQEVQALAGRLEAADYRKIATELFSARALPEAAQVMHEGNLAFPDDPAMKGFTTTLVRKIQEAGDEKATSVLDGLPYAGGD